MYIWPIVGALWYDEYKNFHFKLKNKLKILESKLIYKIIVASCLTYNKAAGSLEYQFYEPQFSTCEPSRAYRHWAKPFEIVQLFEKRLVSFLCFRWAAAPGRRSNTTTPRSERVPAAPVVGVISVAGLLLGLRCGGTTGWCVRATGPRTMTNIPLA